MNFIGTLQKSRFWRVKVGILFPGHALIVQQTLRALCAKAGATTCEEQLMDQGPQKLG